MVKILLTILKLFPPKPLLRFLLWIDRWLYYLQGQVAGWYGQGVHPKHRLMDYHRFFISRIRGDDHVLDIGCGIGAVAYDVAINTGASVIGIDINEKNIAVAKQKFVHPKVQYIVGDALLPHNNIQGITVIILSNVLEHLPNRPTFLANITQSIQPQKFLIRVPLFERDWRVPLKKELGLEWRLDPTHEIEYTLETFAEEIEEAQLIITHLEVRWGEIWAEIKPVHQS